MTSLFFILLDNMQVYFTKLSLKSIGALTNIFSFDLRDIQNGKNAVVAMQFALKGLSAEQVVAAASTLSLDASQTAVALSATKMSTAEVAVTLAMQGYDAATIKSALSTAEFDVAEISAAMSSEAFAAAQGTATVATNTFTASIVNAAKGLATFLTTNPVGWAILATTAIFTLTKVVDALTESFDEALEKSQASQQAYEEQKSKVESLKSELETTGQKIDELNSKGSLTLVEQEELSKLESTNTLLEKQLQIEERIAQYRGAEAAQDAENTLIKKGYNSGMVKQQVNGSGNIDDFTRLDIIDYTIKRQEQWNDLEKQRANLINEQNELRKKNSSSKELENYSSQIQKIEQEQKEIGKDIAENYDIISAQQKSLVDNLGKPIEGYEDTVQRIEQLNTLISDSTGSTSQATQAAQKKINDFLDKPVLAESVEKVKKKTEELNGITVDQFTSQFPELAQKAEEAGLKIEDVVNSINSSVGTVNRDFLKDKIKSTVNPNADATLKEIDEWIDGLSGSKVKILYGLYQNHDTGSWSLSDWKESFESIQNQANEVAASIPQGYEAIKLSIELVTSAQSKLNASFINGDSLTENAYESLKELAGSEEALAGCVDAANGYLITNAEGLNELIDSSEEAAKINLKLSESQQILKHHELVEVLGTICDGLDEYDEESTAVIDSLLEQIDATE